METTVQQQRKALVVFSGGQDSTTILHQVVNEIGAENVIVLSFDYGQLHDIELRAAGEILGRLDMLDRWEVVNVVGALKSVSPLINSESELETYPDFRALPGGIEKTFVPMRNQLFLTIAFNRAVFHECYEIYIGVCEEDYGGYPDCRQKFIDALTRACNYSVSQAAYILIKTPLMRMSKAATVRLAMDIPGAYNALRFTHTAYDGRTVPDGKDHASLLREKGFFNAGVPDPLVLQAVIMGQMDCPFTANYTREAVRSVLHLFDDEFKAVVASWLLEPSSEEIAQEEAGNAIPD